MCSSQGPGFGWKGLGGVGRDGRQMEEGQTVRVRAGATHSQPRMVPEGQLPTISTARGPRWMPPL